MLHAFLLFSSVIKGHNFRIQCETNSQAMTSYTFIYIYIYIYKLFHFPERSYANKEGGSCELAAEQFETFQANLVFFSKLTEGLRKFCYTTEFHGPQFAFYTNAGRQKLTQSVGRKLTKTDSEGLIPMAMYNVQDLN
jgi:hypothetical protein